IAFYDIMSRSVEDTRVREIFEYRVIMEREHIRIFQGMLSEADERQPSEIESAEQPAYLKSLVDNAVFTDDMIASEAAKQTDSDIKALELAISAEKDSILFYYEMKEIVPPPAHPTLNRIIAEEKMHLRRLSELKEKMTAA
ncbi:MAG: ferritin family protein, partial [Dehalococcoidales bacterium]|nr:ferritin family protein [Dehalococcoidales bacterium]